MSRWFKMLDVHPDIEIVVQNVQNVHKVIQGRTFERFEHIEQASNGNLIQQDDFEERSAIIQSNRIPLEMAEGLAALCVLPCPLGISVERWEYMLDKAGRFLDAWKTHNASQLP